MDILRYKKKPDEIDASQFTGGSENGPALVNWINSTQDPAFPLTAVWLDPLEPTEGPDGEIVPGREESILLSSPWGSSHVHVGDYVTLIMGSFGSMTAAEFAKKYELLTTETAGA